MQKSIRRIALLTFFVVVGYSLYSYFYHEVQPNSLRKFYKQQDVRAIKQAIKEIEQKDPAGKKLVPIEVEPSVSNDQKVFSQLKEHFKKLKYADNECKQITDEILKDQDIIDPSAGLFQKNNHVVNALSAVLRGTTDRTASAIALQAMASAYTSVDSLSSEMFFNNLNSLMICRKNRFPIFLDTLVEAFEAKNFNDAEIKLIKDSLITHSRAALTYDHLSDNLLFSLNLIRIAGSLSDQKTRDGVLFELDAIYNKIAQFEDVFYDLGNEKVIRNPIRKIDEYTNELDYIAEEIRLIIQKYFPNN